MKKTLTKLNLKRDTIRTLGAGSLAIVAGGNPQSDNTCMEVSCSPTKLAREGADK